MIKHMVQRFLGWKLPEDFRPDAGISFKPTFNDGTPYQMKHNPIGTNLFDAVQAEAMVRYMLDGLPVAAPPVAPPNASPAAVMAQALRDKAAAESAAAPRQPEGGQAAPAPADAGPLVGGFACRICGRDTPHGAQHHASPAGWTGRNTGFTLQRLLLLVSDQARSVMQLPLADDLHQAAQEFGPSMSFDAVTLGPEGELSDDHVMSAADERAAASGLIYRLLPYLYSSNDSPEKPGKLGDCNGCGFNAVMDERCNWKCEHTPEDTGCAVADAERFVKAVDAEQIAAESAAAPRQSGEFGTCLFSVGLPAHLKNGPHFCDSWHALPAEKLGPKSESGGPQATMSEAKCEVCGRCGAERLRHVEVVGVGRVCPGSFFTFSADEVGPLKERIRESKHLISVRMEGFPCADGDGCENLKTLQAIGAALDGKEI